MNCSTQPRHLRISLVSLVTFVVMFGCIDDASLDVGDDMTESDADGDGDGDGDSGDGDGDSGDGDGDSGDGDGEKPSLGATPNTLCEAATVNLATIVAENQSGNPDPLEIEAAYVGTGLQQFVQLAGAVTGRVEAGTLTDDAMILATLQGNELDLLDLLDIEWRIYLVMQQYIRHEISDVAATLPDPANDPALLYARWDAAWCYWDASLRPLAQLADGVGVTGDSIEADIDQGFAWGHGAIEGVEPWAIDEWVVPPAKQVVEKTTYALAHRLVMQWSADAAGEADPVIAAWYAHQAHGAFQIIEDRMAGKNTPGIAIIEDALLGDPAQIDADDLLTQMNIAFVKRTRKYTDLALPSVDGLMATPEGHAGANEGATYSKLVEPFMLELDGFDLDSYRDNWAAWITAIKDDDVATGEAASAVLTDYNCALQAELGLAECTSSIDEQ